jgi:hypothetical protein
MQRSTTEIAWFWEEVFEDRDIEFDERNAQFVL